MCSRSAKVLLRLLVLEWSGKQSGVPGPIGDSPFVGDIATHHILFLTVWVDLHNIADTYVADVCELQNPSLTM